MNFFWIIFCSFIFVSVASEQREICQKRLDKLEQLAGHIAGAGGWATYNYSIKRSKGRAKTLFNIVNDLNESYQKSSKVLNILNEVLLTGRRNLNATTVAVFGSTETINFKGVVADNQVPFLMLNNKVNWHIGRRFNHDIFSLIFLPSDYSLEDPLFKALKFFFHGLRLKKIIIVKETLAGAQDNRLLSWFYTNDFWQVLLVDVEGNTLALQHVTGKVLKQRTLEQFMRSSINWRNLHGAALNYSLTINPPLTLLQYDAHKNVILKGYHGSVISLFSQHYNATLKTFGLSNLTELACAQHIINEELDICTSALTYDLRYLITDPKKLTKSYLMVPHDKLLARFYYFLKPFQQNVWSVVSLSFFYKVLALSFIHRLQHGFCNSSLHILYAVLSVLNLPFQLTHVKQPYRRFLEIIMMCVGFVVANWYLSVLSSLLFTRLYSHDINSFQSLRDHNISILVDEFEYATLNSTEVDPIIRQQLRLVPDEILARHRRNLDPHYAYYSDDTKINFYLYQQKFLQRPYMKKLKPAVKLLLGGIPMRPNWPFQHLLNLFIKRLLESGILRRFYLDALQAGIHSGYIHFFRTEHHSVEALSIEYFQMPATLLAIGFFLALMAFLLELFVFNVSYENRF